MKFGTSGLRGLSADLRGRASALYAAAFGRHLLDSGLAKAGDIILLGRDFRDSSPEIAENCAAALTSLGFAVADCGTVPTPALALYGLKLKAASLMITGSHIPADRNGIKFYRPDGEIDKTDEVAIAAAAAELDASFVIPATTSRPADHRTICAEGFFRRNAAILPAMALSGLRIGVYQHSTVARDMLVDLLNFFGADTIALGRSETFIPVDTEAVSPETVELLKGWAAQYQLDAIVSADGDGDRPLVTDETGMPLRGDLLGLIAASALEADVVVTPVTSNSGIEGAGDFIVTRTKVGSPFVISGMQEAVLAGNARVMGFEANGGTLTATEFAINGGVLAPLPTRDCFLPMLTLLSRSAAAGKPISAIASSFALPVAAADRLENFPVETSAKLMAYIRQSPDNLGDFLKPIGQPATFSDIDGLRVTLVDGSVIHFRPSGNAPEMRCYVEARTGSAAAAMLDAGLNRISQWATTN